MYQVQVKYQDGFHAHSNWNTRQEAEKQKKVLNDNGYAIVIMIFDENIKSDNGFYYV